MRERERRKGTVGDSRKDDNGTILVIFKLLILLLFVILDFILVCINNLI